MSLVARMSGSGLVLAETAMDEAELGRALKQIDPQLVLQQHGPYYQVLCVTGWDRPDQVHTVLTWMDEYGTPLPLSSGLLEAVKKQHVGARNQGPNADERNQKLAEQIERDRAASTQAVVDDHRAKLERGQVSVSFTDVKRGLRPGRGAPKSGVAR